MLHKNRHKNMSTTVIYLYLHWYNITSKNPYSYNKSKVCKLS